MKKLHFALPALMLLASCNNNEKPTTSAIRPAELAYPVQRADWEMGDFNNTKKIIEWYKMWDEKKSFDAAELFADTFRLHIPDVKQEFVIPNSQISKKMEENRAMYKDASNNILSAVSLHDKASGEDWVMVTTYSKWTETDGTRDSVLYHDDWRLVKGKADLLLSFYKLPPKNMQKDSTGK